MKKATIQMVANKAGVSRGTVDRVIHNRSYVNEEVRQRVLAAMEDLQYTPIHTPDSAAQSSRRPIRLGIIIPTWSDFFNQEILRGVQDFKHDYRADMVDVSVKICGSDLPSEVIEAVDSLVASGVDGLALAALDSDVLRERVDELIDEGFPVILYNSDFSNSKRLLYVGQDVVNNGRIAGELMSKMVRPDATLLVIIGSYEIFSHRERLNGFVSRMKDSGFTDDQIRIIHTFNDYAAFQQIAEALRQDNHIQGIYLAYDTAMGCAEALKRMDLLGKVRVIGHDLTSQSKQLLLQNKIDFIIEQNIYMESYLSLKLLHKYISNPASSLNCSEFNITQIFCKENLPSEEMF